MEVLRVTESENFISFLIRLQFGPYNSDLSHSHMDQPDFLEKPEQEIEIGDSIK